MAAGTQPNSFTDRVCLFLTGQTEAEFNREVAQDIKRANGGKESLCTWFTDLVGWTVNGMYVEKPLPTVTEPPKESLGIMDRLCRWLTGKTEAEFNKEVADDIKKANGGKESMCPWFTDLVGWTKDGMYLDPSRITSHTRAKTSI